jgi:UDP-3-O-[3-hydroxymyristoyl] glucosamine N-acyltransferase
MKRSAAEIAEFVGGELHGALATLESLASLKNAGPADLTYAEEKFHSQVPASHAGCVLVDRDAFPGRTVIVVKNPKVAFARAAALFAQPEVSAPIHRTAVIEPDVTIGDGARIGPGCYVGQGVKLGRNSILYARVVVYAGSEIGNNVIIHAGAVIGADGFGFVWDGERQLKFPQIGRVIIEDDVEIGANTCIDRGALDATIIRRGAKIDNLVQIGHNVEVGEHTVIAAQTGIAGSSKIGARCMIGGQVGIGERVILDDGSIIGGQSGILTSTRIRARDVLWGTPARPIKQLLEQQAALSRLPEMLKELKKKSRSATDTEEEQ